MTADLNVVHASASLALDQGGVPYVVSALSRAQMALIDGNVHIVFRDAGTPLADTAEAVDLHAAPARLSGSILAIRGVLRQAAKSGPVVLHDHGLWLPHNLAASGYAAASGTPYVISPHGMLEPWSLSHKPLKKAVARRLYQDRLLRGAACLLATSVQELEGIRHLGLLNPVAVIPNGIDAGVPVLSRKAPLRPRTALFLSRVHPKKGLVHAIEAWDVLRPRDWRLRIVGPSGVGHREELEALVRQKGLGEWVSFEDIVLGSEKLQCFYDADLFLLPTLSENFGVVVAEALACGVPVLTTSATPWRDLRERGCGWTVETGTEPLIEALPSIFETSDTQLKAMGERGRVWITAEFTWPRIAAQTIAVYEWVLGRSPPPDFVDGGTCGRQCLI